MKPPPMSRPTSSQKTPPECPRRRERLRLDMADFAKSSGLQPEGERICRGGPRAIICCLLFFFGGNHVYLYSICGAKMIYVC